METNSFNPVLTDRNAFTCWLEGDELKTMQNTNMELGGMYDRLKRNEDVEIVPGFYAQAYTGGPAIDKEFEYLADKLLGSLSRARKLDGVLFVLHGAMQSRSIDDCEGYLVSYARTIVGENVPIVASLDFHAMLTKQLVENLNGMHGYHTYPHVDHYETGYNAADNLLQLIESGIRPKHIFHRIPLIMSCENSNTIDSPLVEPMNAMVGLLKEKSVLSGSLFCVQPWLDAPELGCSVCIYYEPSADEEILEKKVRMILKDLWSNRELFYPPMSNIEEVLQHIETMKKPIILVDYGDVPNAGGTGDGTFVLKALLKAKLGISAVVVVADELSTMQALALGEGKRGEFMVGGFGECGSFNERICIEAEVVRLVNEPIVHLGPAMKGFISRPGQRALLRCDNVFIILCEKVCISHDRNMLISMGLDPSKIGVIAMRATHSFMSCYENVMGSWVYVDTPGYSTRDLKLLPFQNCVRPIYPLDAMEDTFVME